MSIIQNVIPFLVPVTSVFITQMLIYQNLLKKREWKVVIVGNLILLAAGVTLSLIGYLVAQGEPGSWAGLGLIILLMITMMTSLISFGISTLVYIVLKPKAKI